MSCFTGQLPGIGTVSILASLQMCKVQRQSPLASQGGWGGEEVGGCWVRGELCKEVTEGGGFALEIVMGGWVFENEGGCKCCQCTGIGAVVSVFAYITYICMTFEFARMDFIECQSRMNSTYYLFYRRCVCVCVRMLVLNMFLFALSHFLS